MIRYLEDEDLQRQADETWREREQSKGEHEDGEH
jgi:hypothetical protein